MTRGRDVSRRTATAPAASATDLAQDRFVADVQYYLTQQPRQLPSRYLYDALGSALFEAICLLPWYPITRAEQTLLRDHAGAIFRQISPLRTIVELGSGSGAKLKTLIEVGRTGSERLDVHLIDVSAAALHASAAGLRTAGDVTIVLHEAGYEDALEEVASASRASGRALVVFLGSNIGNFDPPGADAFVRNVRAMLQVGDGFLVGTDLIKPEADVRLAYDDPLGVTAAFNRNLLVRINRELGGNFDLEAFQHLARWNDACSRVEMHLVATRPQHIHIDRAGLHFELRCGESIWTESSYKYRPSEVFDLLTRASFRHLGQWVDSEHGFALTLVEAA